MKQPIVNLLGMLSLLLGIGFAILYVRGYWRADVLGWAFPEWNARIFFYRGSVLFDADNVSEDPAFWETMDCQDSPPTVDSFPDDDRGSENYSFRFIGFAYGKFSSGSLPAQNVVAVVPQWFLIELILILPTLLMFDTGRKSKPGLCMVCGYDLRASKQQCPECGTAVSTDH